ncbi:cytoplasmic dynein 1 intermediate chain 2-like isoform X2 [Paramacrobiotus metropolitanus]|uniref:cytoplasmic dynein 1 intermediate chain 2-like isoform X2 n=1 Tax=Paramacrobiotus metropolitanus TaxID=2943436 RepID=UPI0024462CFC|nr:cytoplasmic dynein 1 intermediate chain 2-like isoform X2 [Paramacrobiotus metropolitanus]
MDSARQRKEELLRKREKVEEMRRNKQIGGNYPAQADRAEQLPAADDPDEILKKVGIEMAAAFPRSYAAGDGPRNAVNGELLPLGANQGDGIAPINPTPFTRPVTVDKSVSTDVGTEVSNGEAKPRETVSYSKETQTSGLERTEHAMLHYDDGGPTEEFTTAISNVYDIESMKRSQHFGPTKPAVEQMQSVDEEHDLKQSLPELTAEQKQEMMLSEDFRRFFDKTARIVERSLAEDDRGIDIFKDYKGEDLDTLEADDSVGLKVTLQRVFIDEKNVNGRGVSCMDISPHFPELVIASYHNPEEYSTDPGGLANIWNLRFKKSSPEDVFRCHSTLTAVSFAEFHPNLILGGTYSGQIVVWDNRTSKRTPINKSQVAVSTHCHPVFFVKVMGTSHAHNLVTASTDGRICTWSLDMLSQPQELLDLQAKQAKVSTTCLSFPPGNHNNFLAGAEEGAVYAGCRHGSKSGIVESYENHYGPVTSASFHPKQDSPDFAHLFLTSSYDWTVKLWSLKDKKPIYSFEASSDNVYDAKWSPANPAIFATIDGGGSLDFWNLNQDTEIPVLRIPIEGASSASRLQWTPSGQQLLVGDNSGRLHVFDVKETHGYRSEDSNHLKRTIQELKQRSLASDEAEATNAAISSTHSLLDMLVTAR